MMNEAGQCGIAELSGSKSYGLFQSGGLDLLLNGWIFRL